MIQPHEVRKNNATRHVPSTRERTLAAVKRKPVDAMTMRLCASVLPTFAKKLPRLPSVAARRRAAIMYQELKQKLNISKCDKVLVLQTLESDTFPPSVRTPNRWIVHRWQ